ncbi:MAG: hypothetical protein HKL84_04015 [Acidimicrobiaceae bacterium]|nr:hypothetical protein [Acidimicrobiaceae bacterium]
MKRYRIGLIHLFDESNACRIDGLRAAFGGFGVGRIPPHITLVPPANLHPKDVDAEIYRLRKIASETSSYFCEVGPAGTFDPISPVLYLRVGGVGVDPMAVLQDKLLSSQHYKSSSRPFVPHVTLMDPASSAEIKDALGIIKSRLSIQEFRSFEMMISAVQPYWEFSSDFRFEPSRKMYRGGMSLEVFAHTSGDLSIYRMVSDEGISPSLFCPQADLRFRCDGQENLVVSIYSQGQLVACGSANYHSTIGLVRAVVVKSGLYRLGLGSLVAGELLYQLEIKGVETVFAAVPTALEGFIQKCGSRPATAGRWLICYPSGMTLNSWSFSRR